MFTELPQLTVHRTKAWPLVPGVPLVEVVTGKAPEQMTQVKAVWDDEAITFRFEMEDTQPWGTLRRRDEPLYTEEVAEVFLDPVGDLASYFEIEVNPCNTVLDLVLRRTRAGLVKDPRWHCEGLRSEVALTPEGWMAQLTLPLASLTSEPPRPGTRWRAQLCRIDRPAGRARELSAWSPTGQPLFHVPERFGWLVFG